MFGTFCVHTSLAPQGVVDLIGSFGGTSGIALGLSVVARAGGYTEVNAYRAVLRVCAVLALCAAPLAGCLEWLRATHYPNPWREGESAARGSRSLSPVAEIEVSDRRDHETPANNGDVETS